MAASERMATDNTLKAVQGAIERVADAISNSKTGVVYGFHIKKNESSPSGAVTYLRDAVGAVPAHMDYANDVFDYGSWENAFFMPRPCMLKSDGTVDYYLNPNDVSKKEDGTASDIGDASYDGNAMVEWGQNGKKIWLKVVPDVDNLGASVYIADYQADADFHDYPFHNAAGQSMDHFYTAMFRGHLDSNNKLRSLSGKAVMKTKPAADEVTYAKANNPTGKQMWNIDLHSDLFLINCLLILMGKSLDMQTVYGQGLVNSGSEAINDAFTTGQNPTKGMFYGTNSGAAATYTNAVKVFFMENYWGFQHRRYLGHVMVNGTQKVKNTYGTEDGSTVSDYNLTGDGYKSVGATPSGGNNDQEGFIKEHYFTEDGMFAKNMGGGSNTTYYCDYCWYNKSITAVALRGGHSFNGANAGAFSVPLSTAASTAGWGLGAALSCKPLA